MDINQNTFCYSPSLSTFEHTLKSNLMTTLHKLQAQKSIRVKWGGFNNKLNTKGILDYQTNALKDIDYVLEMNVLSLTSFLVIVNAFDYLVL